MSEDCRLWNTLSDQEALGEPLTEQQRRFISEHARGCAACRAEAGVWRALDEALEDPSRLTEPLPTSGSLPASQPPRSHRPRPRARQLAFGAAFLAVAAALALALAWRFTRASSRPSGEPSELAAAKRTAPVARPQLVLVAGTTNINAQSARGGRRLALGDQLEVVSGRACLLVPPGVTVCADEGTRLDVERLEPDARRLRLRHGHAVARLEPQPAGSSFGFETPAGSVIAKGTVFSLQAFDDEVALRVHQGTVVQRRAENVDAFAAPAAVLLSRAAPAVRPTDKLWLADLPLLDVAKHFTDRATCELQVGSKAAGLVSLDHTELGSTPLSALLAPGSYLLGIQQGGLAPVAERLTLLEGARLVRNYEPESLGLEGQRRAVVPRAPAASSQHDHPGLSPTDLLAEARDLRQSGRFSEAAATYARLLREYPTSSEARAATVSLGELQLSQLADAKGALRSFDAYLRNPGALSQEAGYGRIRALQRLGRTGDAERAIKAYLAAYPKSPQAATLRKEAR